MILSTLILQILFGCVPVRVTTEKLTDKSFENYSSFNFLSVDFASPDSIPYSRTSLDFLLSEIKQNMIARGYRLSNNPDLLLNIGIVVANPDNNRGAGELNTDYFGKRNYLPEGQEPVPGIYDEGAITIDVVDASTNKLVWQSTAIGMVTSNESRIKHRISNAVNKIFQKFPLNKST